MNVVWIHEDAINLDHPAVLAAGEARRPIFIWDSAQHDHQGYSLKRRVFIYECALDLGIPIYVGTPQDILETLTDRQTIYTAASPDPYINGIISDLQDTCDVVTVEALAFAEVPADIDTRRFFRFWNQAKKTALQPSKNRSDDNIEFQNRV